MISEMQRLLCDLCANVLFSKNITLPENFDKDELLDEAKKQTVFPIAYTALKGLGVADLNAEKEYYSFIANNIRLNSAHREIGDILSESNIPYVILKGVASAKYYKEPTLRMMGDVDALVRESDIVKVDSALSKHQFSTKDNIYNIGNHVAYIRTINGLTTVCEVHLKVNGVPKEIEDTFDFYMRDMIENSAEISIYEERCFVPDEFHNGMVLVMHTANHLTNEGIGLRHLCDWATFVNNFSDEEFINLFEIPFKKIGLWRFAQILTLCCMKYLGIDYKEWAGNADDTVLDGVITDILIGGNFGRKDITRHYQIKYIKNSETSKISNKKGLDQRLAILNEKAKAKYGFAQKCWLFSIFAQIAVLAEYLQLLLKGERKIDSFDTVKSANIRKKLYSEFKLFEKDQ